MKIKTDFLFPDQYRKEADDYISYKHSLGFSFGYDEQKKCDFLLRYLYMNIPLRRSRLYVIVPEMDPVHKPPSWKYPFLGQDS